MVEICCIIYCSSIIVEEFFTKFVTYIGSFAYESGSIINVLGGLIIKGFIIGKRANRGGLENVFVV
jgi:hypothetical protein